MLPVGRFKRLNPDDARCGWGVDEARPVNDDAHVRGARRNGGEEDQVAWPHAPKRLLLPLPELLLCLTGECHVRQAEHIPREAAAVESRRRVSAINVRRAEKAQRMFDDCSSVRLRVALDGTSGKRMWDGVRARASRAGEPQRDDG